jgi:hypothetical protein
MSQIASFYTVSADKINALLEAAVPQKREVEKRAFIFKRKVKVFDGFWEFLAEHACEQEAYGYSADGFLDLELILAEEESIISGLGDAQLSNQLSSIRKASIAVFDAPAAHKALGMLGRIAITESQVRRYYQQNYPPEYKEPGTEAVLAAYGQVKRWLSAVQGDEIGILIVG